MSHDVETGTGTSEKLLPKGENKQNTQELGELNDQELFLQSVGEFSGMFLFVTIIGYGGSFSLLLGLYVVLVTFAPISGAHFNPTITLGHYITFDRDSHSFLKLIYYWIVQFIGAFCAILLKFFINGGIIAPVISEGTTFIDACFQEFFWGGWLVFINLYVCSSKTSPSKHFLVCVAIFASCLYFNIMATKNSTGASLNPAIAIMGNLWGLLVNGEYRYWRSMWINSVSPLVGCICFALFFKYIFEPGYIKLRGINHAKTELCNEDNIKKELR